MRNLGVEPLASAAHRLPRGLIASYAESLKIIGWKGSTSLNSGAPSMFRLAPNSFETMRHQQFAVVVRLFKRV
jgi:hypothetical protein